MVVGFLFGFSRGWLDEKNGNGEVGKKKPTKFDLGSSCSTLKRCFTSSYDWTAQMDPNDTSDTFSRWVVSNIFYFHPEPRGNDSIWGAYLYFSNGGSNTKVTRQCLSSMIYWYEKKSAPLDGAFLTNKAYDEMLMGVKVMQSSFQKCHESLRMIFVFVWVPQDTPGKKTR